MSDERNSDTDSFDELCGPCMGIDMATVTDEDIYMSAEALNSDPANINNPDFVPYDEDDIRAAIRGRDSYIYGGGIDNF